MSNTILKRPAFASLATLMLTLLLVGCRSPYYADRGAAAGGLAGAGIGALVGSQTGNAGAGAAIGAGVGALTGTVFGEQLDELAARNRAEIAGQLGRPVVGGAATIDEVVAMTRAGVAPNLIANYVSTSGVARPVTANDLIVLHQQGVAPEVVSVMQNPPPRQPVVAAAPPRPVVIEEHHYGAPVCYPPPYRAYHRRRCHGGPRVGWGISISN